MIDEAGRIVRDVSVYHGVFARPEKVFAFVRFHLARTDVATFVFDDAGAGRYVAVGKKPASGARAFDAKVEVCRFESARYAFERHAA